MRVLGIDAGMHLGWGFVQLDGPVACGSVSLPGNVRSLGKALWTAKGVITKLIADHAPTLIVMAEPYIRHRPVPTADAIRPLFAITGFVEMMAYEFKCEFVEVNEREARSYFMDPIPVGSRAQKAAAIQFAWDRKWPVIDDHSADALLIAAYALALKLPDRQHELLPLYQRRKHERAA